ncbi:hypothetical protein A3C86_02455 [Candidatus Kaiserbacteria bacterium RIFCSPHIGHO2_02_FULL_49_16]|uniref:NodB homology domain-containing protein n=1 Tax=Candidatus Kaiserbacteria bacterium RIFCSPHIGHO2_02_FULL_49_16 TaxID=1798490 RepID=A0A1F6DCT8_9BACT|nr:MAG: hypothetical protein A3C86_02455 [Candidatus Kaiserbacteria bacterium RIFCSPHIGHO2_02_FULL_49_16]
MKRLFKEIFFRLTNIVGLPEDRASILMYHSISESDYFASVKPSEFKRQMSYLAGKKIPVISLAELVRRLKTGESMNGSAVITFDDGYRDNYTAAFPVLKKYGLPATIFVTTNLIGKKDTRGLERLTIADMKEMEASGLIAIAPHTKSHMKLSTLSNEAARDEIAGSKRTLEEAPMKRAGEFAYPFGDFNDETVRLVIGAGFDAAVTALEGTVGPNDDQFRLKRNSIDRSTSFSQFKGKLSRAVDLYQKLKS